jgi:hypothetical protein
MRQQITTLVLGALGALGGGWLVGVWCFGLVLIALSGGAIAWALLHDDGTVWQPQVYEAPNNLASILERARNAS